MKERHYLDRVSKRRSRAVRFQGTRDLAAFLYSSDQPFLRGPVRRRQARARSVLLHRGTADPKLAHGCTKQECPAALPAAVPVGTTIERVASSERREHARRQKSERYRPR